MSYHNIFLFLIILFLFTILIQFLDQTIEKESFKRRKRRKFKLGKKLKSVGKSIKKFAQSKAGIATFSAFAAVGCGLATGGLGAAACAGAVSGGIMASKNAEAKKKYKKDKKREGRRRARVLTGREDAYVNPKGGGEFDGAEALPDPCEKFREDNCYNKNNNNKCKVFKKQCALARSVTFYDSHLIQEGRSKDVEGPSTQS